MILKMHPLLKSVRIFDFIIFHSINDFHSMKHDKLLLDPMTGLITTTKQLDRETKSTYKIIIEVSDNGQPPQSATRVLRIQVLDIDDHKPRFVRDIVRQK